MKCSFFFAVISCAFIVEAFPKINSKGNSLMMSRIYLAYIAALISYTEYKQHAVIMKLINDYLS